MIPFTKPGTTRRTTRWAPSAARLALADAGFDYAMVQQAFVGYVYGDSTCGQRALYEVGMTGIPIVNVNNNCSTGSTALFLARQAIAARRGRLRARARLRADEAGRARRGVHRPADAVRPLRRGDRRAGRRCREIPLALRYFGGAGREHMQQVRHEAGDVREDPGQGAPACREQPARAVPQSPD